MKTLIFTLVLLASMVLSTPRAEAFPEFEPSIACAVLGAVGYTQSPKGQELMGAAATCALGYAIGHYIDSHFKEKHGAADKERIRKLEQDLDAIQMNQAKGAYDRKEGGYYRVKTRVIRGQKLPNGAVRAPTLETYLDDSVTPSEVRPGM